MSASSRYWWIILFFCCFTISNSFAQKSKAQLEKDRKDNLQRIVETERILEETETERKASIGQLTAINKQIQSRQNLISSLKEEIGLLDGEISDLTIVVNALQQDLKNLKEEYAAMIYATYRSNWGYQTLTFLFSSKTFNQLFRRLEYLNQYSEARQLQVEQIEVVSKALAAQRTDVESKKEQQNALLTEQIRQNRNLTSLKNKQSELIAELGKKEEQLKKEVADRKKSILELDKLIADIIKKEQEEKASAAQSSAQVAQIEKVSTSFEESRNNLSWPVETGFISSRFGKQPHPVLKGIMVDNQGVDIQTNKDAQVKSVFEGKVATVAFVPGMNSVVIVQHGDYYTLYAKLKKVNVKKGQLIAKGDQIGEVFTDAEGVSEVQFQVWKSNNKLDPAKWLAAK
ncbi:MAG: peptidoglycan DD-metalloendopeptidase family protein [Bacteroidota bacterium]